MSQTQVVSNEGRAQKYLKMDFIYFLFIVKNKFSVDFTDKGLILNLALDFR